MAHARAGCQGEASIAKVKAARGAVVVRVEKGARAGVAGSTAAWVLARAVYHPHEGMRVRQGGKGLREKRGAVGRVGRKGTEAGY